MPFLDRTREGGVLGILVSTCVCLVIRYESDVFRVGFMNITFHCSYKGGITFRQDRLGAIQLFLDFMGFH